MYYYCIVCRELHLPEKKSSETADAHTIFKTGFHYVNDSLHNAGMCQPAESRTPQVQSATA